VDGRSYLDGNASWWVAGLGHGTRGCCACCANSRRRSPTSRSRGITHEPAAALAAELCAVAPPGLTHVFYTDNGSTAVEAAVKIAVQSQRQRGREQRTRFVALDGAFHGDTVGAASLGGVEIFRRPFAGVLFDCVHAPVPEEGGHARAFEAISAILAKDGDRTAAVVVEPVVQGAAGMRVYDAGLPAGAPRALRSPRDAPRVRRGLLGLRAHRPDVGLFARRGVSGHPVRGQDVRRRHPPHGRHAS